MIIMKENPKLLKTLALFVSTTLMTSCASFSDNQRVELEATSLSSITGAVAGAAVGAGVGALAGKLSGKDTKDAAIDGAIAGGILGLFEGYKFGQAWTKTIIKKKESYASNICYIKANIDQLEYRKDETQAQINHIDSMMVKIKSKQANKIDKKTAASIKEYAQTGVKLIDTDLRTARKAQKNASGEELKKLKSEIAALSVQRTKLRKQSLAISSSAYCA